MEVSIHIPAIRVEEIENKHTSKRTVETQDETKVVITEDVTANPNFDYYLQPMGDLLYNYTGRAGVFIFDDVEFHKTGDAEIYFDCYPDELREAAQVRASEDHCHEVHVLAEWTHLTKGTHESLHYVLQEALDEASKRHPDAEYRMEIGGGADLLEDTTDGSLGAEQ